ncbi:uncharacterized protein LOC110455523 isoform X2 [Mizuhopecten yessoensis]|uniref:uncharacterized protein LOC110455523 isoform X2 n=1 Tax=Mizuhopecten yessoensis TaxID=6573 RepID=UPI000B45DC0C|nr:uncharacterized protein LOC110455523 isoform X2 [Mizuhopecten yessoensis]
MSCLSRNNGEFDCNGPLILTPSKSSNAGKFYLTCSSTEENHDCVCSPTRDFNVTTCVPRQTDSTACSGVASNTANPCTITWKGDYTDFVDVLPLSCERVLVSPSCKTRCQQKKNGTVQCKGTIICSASPGPTC